MAAAQFNSMVPDLTGQNSMKAMLIQKHLSELEHFNKNNKINEEIRAILKIKLEKIEHKKEGSPALIAASRSKIP